MDSLINNIWLALGLWASLYISDYLLTITTARIYQGGANQHVVYEKGIELTPLHQKDVARLRWVSPRFLAILILTCLLLWLVWLSTVHSGGDPELYEFLLGAWILLEASVHMRHFRNLFTFYYFRKSQGVEGQIRYASWLSYRISSVDMLGFTVLYLLIFFLIGRQFLLGGALACLATTVYHLFLGYRARKAPWS